MELKQTKHLLEDTGGIYLAGNHAKMIWQGNKNLIVRETSYNEVVGKSLYLISNNECYGVIKIESVTPIDINKFKSLAERHRITENERIEWWSSKKVLYSYEFSLEKKFDVPMRVSIPEGIQTFIDKVEFLSDQDSLLMKAFAPMKSSKKFFELGEVLDFMYGG